MNDKLNHTYKYTRNFLTRNVGIKINGKSAFKSKYFNISRGYSETKNPIYVAFNKHGNPFVYDVNLGKVLTEKDGYKVKVNSDSQYREDFHGFSTDTLAYYSIKSILITDKDNNKRVYANGMHAETGDKYKSIERISASRNGSQMFVCIKHDNTFDIIKPDGMKKLNYNEADLRKGHNPYLYSIINIQKPYDSYKRINLDEMLESFENYFGKLSSEATTDKEKREIGKQKAILLNSVVQNITTQYEEAQPMIEKFQSKIKSAKNELDAISKIEVDYENEKSIKDIQRKSSDVIESSTNEIAYFEKAAGFVPALKEYLQETLETHNLVPSKQQTAQQTNEQVEEQERTLGR